MRLSSIRLRIFLSHLAIMALLVGLTWNTVSDIFTRAAREWNEQAQTVAAQSLFKPLANEVGRSLLLAVEEDFVELRSARRREIADALESVLPTLDSIHSLMIVDDQLRPQYVHPPYAFDLELEKQTDLAQRLELREERVDRVLLGSGEWAIETVVPVWDDAEEPPRRLGSLILRSPGTAPPPEGESAVELTGSELVPFARSVARTILREPSDSAGEGERLAVSEGLKNLVRELGDVESLFIVDRDLRIRFSNDPRVVEEGYRPEKREEYLARENGPPVELDRQGGSLMQVTLPITRDPEMGLDEANRLGWVQVEYLRDPDLLQRVPALKMPEFTAGEYLQEMVIFLIVAFVGGVLMAGLSGLPVRRLERALSDYRARGFRGGLDPRVLRLDGEFGSTVEAIREMGGKLETLDEQGREREALLATLSQSLEEAMIALDPGGNPVAWNSAAVRMLTGSGSVTGEPEESEVLRRALERNPDLSFAAQRAEPGGSRELELWLHDDSRVPAQTTAVPFELRPGETGTLLLIRDMAMLRKVESHLLEAGRFAVLAHLAAGLAHEIRNPLHAIQLNASVVEQYVDTSGEDRVSRSVRDSLSTIRDETQRLADLLNNYLGLVRPAKQSGPVDLRELGRRVIQLVAYSARKAGVEIKLEGEVYPPPIRGVSDRLQQAILNLVLNAIQAMPEGGTVRIAISSSAGVVRLTVSDTGPGLAQELADELFDTRVTTKPGGSGLGLPLVRMIAEAHGGSVWYRSNPGEGAAFSLVLPAERESASG